MTRLDPAKTASFDVDAQKGFTPLCPDELPVPGGHEIAAELNAQASLAAFRLGSKDAHSPSALWVATESKPQFSPVEGAPDLDIHWAAHCVVGTRGYESLDGLPAEMDYDFFVYKGVSPDLHPYGACYHNRLGKARSTGAIEFLRQSGVESVIVGGLATDYCVKATALQLRGAGFRVILNLAACRGIKADLSADIEEMRSAGVEVFSDSASIASIA